MGYLAAPPEVCGIGEGKLLKAVGVLYPKKGEMAERLKQQESLWGQTTGAGPEEVPGLGRPGRNPGAHGIWLEKRSLDNCLQLSPAWEENETYSQAPAGRGKTKERAPSSGHERPL